MNIDMTVPCDNGLINIRVGTIILKNGKFLMVGNNIRPEYLYSVGGRIKCFLNGLLPMIRLNFIRSFSEKNYCIL